MKAIEFKEQSAQKIYADYIARVKRCTSILPSKDSQEIVMEFNSHIYEGMQRNVTHNEIETLLDILDTLGSPEVVLQPLLAEKKLDQAVRTFNPRHLVYGLFLNIKDIIVSIVLTLLALLLACVLFLIATKIIYPKQTGLFLENGEFRLLGFGSSVAAYTEVAGNWFIPLIIALGVVLYFFIVLLLRLLRKK